MGLITVRKAVIEDIPLISELGRLAFYPTYLPFISKEQVDYMYHMMYEQAALHRQMNERGDVFFIAYSDRQAAGYASCQTTPDAMAKLHKLYVLPDIQVKGLGGLMLRTVEDYARAEGQHKLLLNVNRNNKAVGFYEHLGYAIYRTDDIDIGNGYFMNDYEMIKSLK